eukprot:gene6461-7193_t
MAKLMARHEKVCELADDTLQILKPAIFTGSSHVKRAGELNLESLKMDGFDKSLYRSLARSCGSECSWAALKMAVIHKSILDEDLIEEIRQHYIATSMQQLMKELYDGDTASRRYTKNYKYLFQLNCFLGQFSNERYSVLIDCLCEWLDIVPKSDQHICGDSFFLNVVITEVLIFLVEKECLVTRLNAERIVDGVFHQAS